MAQKIFAGITVRGSLMIEAGGGLVDVMQKAYRGPWERRLGLAPDIAREVARAMLSAADAAEGKFDGVPAEHTVEIAA